MPGGRPLPSAPPSFIRADGPLPSAPPPLIRAHLPSICAPPSSIRAHLPFVRAPLPSICAPPSSICAPASLVRAPLRSVTGGGSLVPRATRALCRRGPNHALQRTEAGGRLFCVFHVLRRQPPSLSLSPLGPGNLPARMLGWRACSRSSVGTPFLSASQSLRSSSHIASTRRILLRPIRCPVLSFGPSIASFIHPRRQHPHSPAGVAVASSGGPEAPL